jgi:hypothetical protein
MSLRQKSALKSDWHNFQIGSNTNSRKSPLRVCIKKRQIAEEEEGQPSAPKIKEITFLFNLYEKSLKLFAELGAKKMAGGRGEKPPCRVRLLKRRRYVWAI